MKNGARQRKRPAMIQSEAAKERKRQYMREYDAKRLAKQKEETAKRRALYGETRGRPRGDADFIPDTSVCIPVSEVGSIKLLAMNVIRQAVIDWRRRNRLEKYERQMLLEWFRKFDFENWCDAAGIDPDCVLQELKILRVDHQPE